MESLNPLLILSKRVPLSLLPPDPDNLDNPDNLDTTKIRLEFPQRLWLHGRELLLHLNEQITEVLFLEKDVSRRVGQKVALTGGLRFSQRLVYHVWQYSGGLVENINYKLQLADTDCTLEKDQSIGQRLVGLHKISLIRFQRFAVQKSNESSSWFASRDRLSWHPVGKY